MRSSGRFVPVALAVTATSLLTGCRAADEPSTSITVLAASSLTESFTVLGDRFEAAHPGVRVTFSFASSSSLATQIASGAPADVFAAASAPTMQQVVDAGDAVDAAVFARNSMEIAVPPSNPGGVAGVDDLARPDVTTATCQPQVPCGAAARKVFDNAGLTVSPVTLEPDVKSVLTKVELGEVDAGVVFVTDVKAAGDRVTGVPVPDDVNATSTYPIAVLDGAAGAAVAKEFVAYVLSPDGQSVLVEAGFVT